MIVKRERRGFFHAHASRSNPAIAQSGRRDFRGALILLPDADFRRELQLLAQASLFKPRHHNYGIARARKHERQEPFAVSPTDAREVVKGSPGSKEQNIVFWRHLGHQFLRVLQAPIKLSGRDRMNPGSKWFEP